MMIKLKIQQVGGMAMIIKPCFLYQKDPRP